MAALRAENRISYPMISHAKPASSTRAALKLRAGVAAAVREECTRRRWLAVVKEKVGYVASLRASPDGGKWT